MGEAEGKMTRSENITDMHAAERRGGQAQQHEEEIGGEKGRRRSIATDCVGRRHQWT